MSIRIMNAAWHTKTQSHTVKLVLLALADNANDQGICWPSINTIGRKCNLSRQGVLSQIEKLQQAGMVKTMRTQGKVNRYQITLQPVNEVDPSMPLTRQRGGLLPVNEADYYQSTPLTPPVNEVDPNHQEPPIEPPIEPPTKKRSISKEDHPGFEEFWQAYPRREAKKKSLESWNREKPELTQVLSAIKHQKTKWKDPQFIPLPTSYLNGRRFEDEKPKGLNNFQNPMGNQPLKLVL